MTFIPDPGNPPWPTQPCTDQAHSPPGMWVPQSSGWWVCPSCGAKTRVEPSRTICTGRVADPNNAPGTYTQGKCCGNCIICPYKITVTYTQRIDSP